MARLFRWWKIWPKGREKWPSKKGPRKNGPKKIWPRKTSENMIKEKNGKGKIPNTRIVLPYILIEVWGKFGKQLKI